MVIYREITSDDYPAVQTFLMDNGWASRVSEVERFRKMIEGANRAVVAIDGARVVGFARALCDNASNGYISMQFSPKALELAATYGDNLIIYVPKQ